MNRDASTPTDRPSPRKSLGQHFLVDQDALSRVVAAAELEPTDLVVEVGPGTGLLTRLLAQNAARVVAVELDQALVIRLQASMAGSTNVTVVHGDAREWEPTGIAGPYKVVANLPYYAANPILRRFLECSQPPEVIVVTVQREVAHSMTAAPGRMRLLSVAVQLYGNARVMGYIKPDSFRPPPKVTSAIVRIDTYPEPALTTAEREGFFTLVRGGFGGARKQLRNTLGHSLGIPGARAEELLREADIAPTLRPEALGLEQWIRLYRVATGCGLC